MSVRSWCTTSHCHAASPGLIKCRRLAHTRHSNNPFPYPSHRNPTPHQIFHLPHSASEAEIKARYYDLVRLYHPDKVVSSSLRTTPADEAHARFQAVTTAYDKLRGKATPGNPCDETAESKLNQYQTTAAYRAMQRKRQELYNSGAVDDSRMDKWLITGVVATTLFVVIHNLTTRREAIAEAVSRTRAIATEGKNRRIQEAEQRLSLDAVERGNSQFSSRIDVPKT